LRTTMHELGDLLSEEEIQAFMAVMDVNNDGVIGFQEFIDTLKTQTTELIPSGRPDPMQQEAEVRRPADLGGWVGSLEIQWLPKGVNKVLNNRLTFGSHFLPQFWWRRCLPCSWRAPWASKSSSPGGGHRTWEQTEVRMQGMAIKKDIP